jgi:hypothetical protein
MRDDRREMLEPVKARGGLESLSGRLDRIDARIERIERRLDPISA